MSRPLTKRLVTVVLALWPVMPFSAKIWAFNAAVRHQL